MSEKFSSSENPKTFTRTNLATGKEIALRAPQFTYDVPHRRPDQI